MIENNGSPPSSLSALVPSDNGGDHSGTGQNSRKLRGATGRSKSSDSLEASPSRGGQARKIGRSHSIHRPESSSLDRSSISLPLNFSNLALYSREGQLGCLRDAYERVVAATHGAAQVVLVGGPSGTGKTALVLKFKEELQGRSPPAMFVSGKFVQSQTPQSTPYSAIVQALTEQCQRLRERDEFNEYQDQVRKELGEVDWQKMTDLVPALGWREGMQPTMAEIDSTRYEKTESDSSSSFSLPQLSGPLAFTAFARTFRHFLTASCSTSRPMVMLLDDLQWADENSRMIVQSIATASTVDDPATACSGLLLIGAFRDDEDVPLFHLESSQGLTTMSRLSTCSVGGLSINDVTQMLSDLLETRDNDGVRELAEIVLRRTSGNCYFVVEYIKSLYTGGHLRFDFNQAKWVWDLDSIRAKTNVSSNVVDLLIGRIETLPVDVQTTLMVGSCLGFMLDTNIVEYVLLEGGILDLAVSCNDSTTSKQKVVRERVRSAADIAVNQGLIELVDPPDRYKFVHDRVQQSLLNILQSKNSDGSLLEVRIGYYLLKLSESGSLPLFAGLDLLNKHKHLIKVKDERTHLAKLNLRAGRLAMKLSAFVPAAQYFLAGLEFLDKTIWVEQYELGLQLSILYAEMQHVNGLHAGSLRVAEEVVMHARQLSHRLLAYDIQVRVNYTQLDLAEAMHQATLALQYLGISLPRASRRIHAAFEWYKTRKLLQKFTHQQLVQLPMLSDPKKHEALKFLRMISMIAEQMAMKNLTIVACLRMVQIAVQSGWSVDGLYGIAGYAALLNGQGNFSQAYELGTVCLDVIDSWSGPLADTALSMVSFIVFSRLWHLRNPLHDCLEPLLHGYRVGMEVGNVQAAVRCLFAHGICCILVGMKTANLEKALRSSYNVFKEQSQGAVFYFGLPNLQFTLNLAGKSVDPLILTGEMLDENVFLEQMSAANNALSLNYFWFLRTMLHVIMDSYETANEDRKKCDINGVMQNFMWRFFYAFYAGLCCLCLARKYPAKRKVYLRQAYPYVRDMARYVQCECINFVPMHKLFTAELVSLHQPKPEAVKAAYDQAIRDARRSGFRMIVGIAAERAADFFLLMGSTDLAHEYLELSVAEFYDCGAHAKVSQMQQCYGDVLHDIVIKLKGREEQSDRSSGKLRGIEFKTWKGPNLSEAFSLHSSNHSGLSSDSA